MIPPPRILVIAGSTLADSPTGRLAGALVRELAFLDAEPTLISLADYVLPLFDPEQAAAPPVAVIRLRELLRSHHGTFLVASAHAGGLPALVRNLIEWLAIDPPSTGNAPAVALATAAEDDWGAGGALAELQAAVTRNLGAGIVGGLPVGRAALAFDARGRIDDPRLAARLQRLVRDLVDAATPRVYEP